MLGSENMWVYDDEDSVTIVPDSYMCHVLSELVHVSSSYFEMSHGDTLSSPPFSAFQRLAIASILIIIEMSTWGPRRP